MPSESSTKKRRFHSLRIPLLFFSKYPCNVHDGHWRYQAGEGNFGPSVSGVIYPTVRTEQVCIG